MGSRENRNIMPLHQVCCVGSDLVGQLGQAGHAAAPQESLDCSNVVEEGLH